MNPAMVEPFQTIVAYYTPRNQLLDLLSDPDLTYSPGGSAETLGQLLRELGETQHSYSRSFATFTRDLSYRNPDPALETSVAALKAWFAELDTELEAAIEALSDDDVASRRVDYGPVKRGVFAQAAGFEPGYLPAALHLDVFREALLIFYGKASVYMKALGTPRSAEWTNWIA